MGIFKLKTVLLGLSSVLAATSLVVAQDDVISSIDGEFDDNQNDFGFYWYYYDDNTGVGENDRPNKAPNSKPSVIDVEYTDSIRHAFGDESDTYKIKKYTFAIGSDADNSYATMPFTPGETWTASYGKAQPFVGIGTMLCANGYKIDLTGATAFRFKIRSHKNDLTVRFKVQTKEIDEISEVPKDKLDGDEFGYWNAPVPVTTSWKEQEVKISDLERPSWAAKIAFNIKSITKIAWEVSGNDNTSLEQDTLDIDDIQVVGYKFVDPTFWYQTASMNPPENAIKLSTFEDAPLNQSTQGYYWYAYNDVEIGGKSGVTEGATEDEETKRLFIEIKDGTGSDGEGHSAMLGYQLGKAVMQNGNSVQGFVGIGINTYDSSESKYWDAKADGAKAIYFHYFTDGDAKKVTLEISDKNDVGDADNPTRKDSRGSGVVYYRNLPPTDGEWRAVQIPLDSLVWNYHWDGVKEIPFNQSALAKIQWKVQGKEGLEGIFAIDNVYFSKSTPVKVGKISSKTSPFHVSYLNGNVNINWNNNVAFTNGKISLVNIKGAVVSSASIAKSNKVSASFSAKTLPSGMYFVNFSGIDANGKSVAKQAPISIVK